jgi:plasmid stabilization system protein ParE
MSISNAFFEFLLDENPDAAAKAMLAIDDGAAKLEDFPKLGISMNDDSGRRELFVSFGKSVYVLRYRINSAKEEIAVLRVWHGREKRH